MKRAEQRLAQKWGTEQKFGVTGKGLGEPGKCPGKSPREGYERQEHPLAVKGVVFDFLAGVFIFCS